MHDRTVHVVDDDAGFRASLRAMLEANGFVVAEYGDGHAFLEAITPAPQGCVLVDVRMPGMDGFALQTRLRELAIEIPVIVITGAADVAMAVRAMKAGAVDFLEKPFKPSALIEAIRLARSRTAAQSDCEPEVAAFRERLPQLTEREREILEGIVAGLPFKVIAYRLGISPRTVEVHRAHIGDKLGVTGLSNLVRLALAASVVSGPKWR